MTSRILVIDDDESTLELYREFLEAEGFEPHLSLISFENLSEVAHLRPDLIILDAKIKAHNDGLLFMQNLRRYPPTSAIPVILCTAAWQDMREQENVLRQKGVPVIYKPFDLEELLHTIRRTLAPLDSTNRA